MNPTNNSALWFLKYEQPLHFFNFLNTLILSNLHLPPINDVLYNTLSIHSSHVDNDDGERSICQPATTVDVAPESKDKGWIAAAAKHGGYHRGVAIFDFLLRLAALISALAAAAAMGTSDEILPVFTQFFQFQANYDDLPTFQFFVIAMGIVGSYLVLSLPFSIVCIVRPQAAAPRFLLLVLDIVALTLSTTAAAAAVAAAAAIVYLTHNGNSNTNWLAICQQFRDFCQKVSEAVVAGFVAVVMFIALVILSVVALRRH